MKHRASLAWFGGVLFSALAMMFAVVGCKCNSDKNKKAELKPPTAEEILAEEAAKPKFSAEAGDEGYIAAKELYGARCASCHGTKGKSDGPDVGKLKTKPRDFSDPLWQGMVTDGKFRKAIVDGQGEMPGNPDLAAKPEVVEGLVRIVRDFRETN